MSKMSLPIGYSKVLGLVDIDTAYSIILGLMAFALLLIGILWIKKEYSDWKIWRKKGDFNSDKSRR